MCQLEEKAVINYNRVLSITQDNFQVLTRTSLLSQDRTFREPWCSSVPVRPLPSQKTGKPKVVPKLRVMKCGGGGFGLLQNVISLMSGSLIKIMDYSEEHRKGK